MKERSSILWQKINKTAIPGNQWRVRNICPGLIYEFKVAAENAAGIGKLSKTSEEVLAIDACGELFFFCVQQHWFCFKSLLLT